MGDAKRFVPGLVVALLTLSGALAWIATNDSASAQAQIFDESQVGLHLEGPDSVGAVIGADSMLPGGPPARGHLVLHLDGVPDIASKRLDLNARYVASEANWSQATSVGLDLGHYLAVTTLRYGDEDLLVSQAHNATALLDMPPAGNGDGRITLDELVQGINDLPAPGHGTNATALDLAVALTPDAPNTVMGDRVALQLNFLARDANAPSLNGAGEGPVVALSVSPTRAVVPAGQTVSFTVRALDALGRPVAGVRPSFEVGNRSLATVDALGGVTGFRPGATNLTVRAAGFAVAADVVVVPGPLAALRVVPSHATVPASDTLQFRAEGLDALGNPRPDAPVVSWASEDPANGTIDVRGVFAAADHDGVARLNATAGTLFKEFVVTIVGTDAPAGQDTSLDATTARSDNGAVTARDNVAGVRNTQAGADLNINVSDAGSSAGVDDRGGVQSASVEMGAASHDLSLVFVTQPGGHRDYPDEVDPTVLGDALQSLSGSPTDAGLYLSVRATEDGIQVNSTRLNELLNRTTIRFDVNRSYFVENRLDPNSTIILEFSNGVLERADLRANLTGNTSVAYEYEATFDQFSSFAIAWTPAAIVGNLGPGGGSGGGSSGAGGSAGGSGGRGTGAGGGGGEPPPVALDVARQGSAATGSALLGGSAGSTLVVPLAPLLSPLGTLTLQLAQPLAAAAFDARAWPADAASPALPTGFDPRWYLDLRLDAPTGAVSSSTLTFRVGSADLQGRTADVVALFVQRDGVWLRVPLRATADGDGLAYAVPAPPGALYALAFAQPAAEPLRPTSIVGLPPELVPLEPPPGTWTNNPRPLLAARVDGGTGIDVGRSRVRLDGVPIATAATEDAIVALPQANLTEGVHAVDVDAVDLGGQVAHRSWEFRLDRTPPAVTGGQPIGSVPNGQVVIRARFADAGSGINRSSVQLLLDGQPVDAQVAGSELAFQPPKALPPGRHVVEVVLDDQTGNGQAAIWSFTVASAFPAGLLAWLLLPAAVGGGLWWLLGKRRRRRDEPGATGRTPGKP